MPTRHLSAIVILFLWTGLVDAADLSGKLTVQVSGREQGIFEKSTLKFEKQNPKVRTRIVELEGSDPLAAVKDGTVDFAVLCRDLLTAEKDLSSTVVGWDGIAVLVNASNWFAEASIRQLYDIFNGS